MFQWTEFPGHQLVQSRSHSQGGLIADLQLSSQQNFHFCVEYSGLAERYIRKKSSPLEAIPCTWVTLPRLMRL